MGAIISGQRSLESKLECSQRVPVFICEMADMTGQGFFFPCTAMQKTEHRPSIAVLFLAS